jgi:hypothetical protein
VQLRARRDHGDLDFRIAAADFKHAGERAEAGADDGNAGGCVHKTMVFIEELLMAQWKGAFGLTGPGGQELAAPGAGDEQDHRRCVIARLPSKAHFSRLANTNASCNVVKIRRVCRPGNRTTAHFPQRIQAASHKAAAQAQPEEMAGIALDAARGRPRASHGLLA